MNIVPPEPIDSDVVSLSGRLQMLQKLNFPNTKSLVLIGKINFCVIDF